MSAVESLTPERNRFAVRKSTLCLVFLAGVLLTIVCILVSIWFPYDREQRVVQAIEQLGGTVKCQFVGPNWLRAGVGDERLRNLKVFDRAVEVTLIDAPIMNSDAAALSHLNNLEVIYLNGGAVGDSALIHLHSLSKLRVLDLSRTMITDAGVSTLRGLSKLEFLSLYGTPVGDPAVDDLKSLTHLASLDLRRTRMTNAGRDKLAHALPGCIIEPEFFTFD